MYLKIYIFFLFFLSQTFLKSSVFVQDFHGLIRLLDCWITKKSTWVTIIHNKNYKGRPITAKIKGFCFCYQKYKKINPQEQEAGPRSKPYLLVATQNQSWDVNNKKLLRMFQWRNNLTQMQLGVGMHNGCRSTSMNYLQ